MGKLLEKSKIKNSYFYGIFRVYLLFLIPVVLFSVLSYYYIQQSKIDEANLYNNSRIAAIAAQIRSDIFELDRLSYLVIKTMQRENVESFSMQDVQGIHRSMYKLENLRSMLASLKTAKENIFRIFIHIPKSELLVSDDGIYDYEEYYSMFTNYRDADRELWAQRDRIDYLKLFATAKISKMSGSIDNKTMSEDVNVIPMAISYRTFEGIDVYLIMNIQEKYFSGLLNANLYSKGTKTFVLDQQGEVISHSDSGELYRSAYRELAAHPGLLEGSGREIEFMGGQYIVYGQKVGFPNWTVYSMVPHSDYFQELRYMIRLLLAINVLILCTGVFAAYFFSSRLYSPIRHLMNVLYGYSGKTGKTSKKAHFDEIEFIKDHLQILQDAKADLEIKLNKMTPVVKENIVKNLMLYGDHSVSDKEIAALFQEYDIRLSGKNVLLGVCHLYYSRAFTVDFPAEDQRVIRRKIPYTIGKIVQAAHEHALVMELADCRWLIVLSGDEDDLKERFCSVFDEIDNLLKEDRRYIKMRLAVSDPAPGILALAAGFPDVQTRLDFVNLSEDGFLVEERTMDRGKELLLPPNFEETLTHAAAGGQSLEIEALIGRVFQVNFKFSVTPFKFERLVHLLFEQAERAMQTLGCALPLDEYRSDPAFRQYDVEGAKRAIALAWKEMAGQVKREPQDDKKYSLQEYIEAHYMNETLSLQSMAGELGFHTNYLSRLFKEQTGKTFTDYLSEVRIAKAKQLIVETDDIMDEVAAKVGISNRRTFNRMFKKWTGMSPAMYRIVKS